MRPMNIREARMVSEALKKFNITETPEHIKALSKRGHLLKLTKGNKEIEDTIRETLNAIGK